MFAIGLVEVEGIAGLVIIAVALAAIIRRGVIVRVRDERGKR